MRQTLIITGTLTSRYEIITPFGEKKKRVFRNFCRGSLNAIIRNARKNSNDITSYDKFIR